MVEPYAVKEFKNSWYLIAVETSNAECTAKTFGLDRISDLDINTKLFEKRRVDINTMFTNSFGIISTEGEEPRKIVLSFDHYQGKFVKTLPLHHSQKTLIENHDEFRIELTLVPTYDFYQELLAHAERLTILEPKEVKKEYTEFLKLSFNKNT